MVSLPKPPRGVGNPRAAFRGGVRRAASSPGVRSVAERTPVSQAVVSRYVAGTDSFAAVRQARGLLNTGRHVTLFNIRPPATTVAEAEAATDELLGLLDLLGRAGLTEEGRAEVSVRLSALGQALAADGPAIATERAHLVCERAAAVGTTVTLDMEDHTTTDLTLETVRELRADHPWVGVVLQTALRRTEADCRDLNGVGSRVRLVKGEYEEPSSVAHTVPGDIDRAFARCLKILVRGSGYPMIATHDRRLVDIGQALMTHEGRTTDSYEYQMLHGVGTDQQRRLVELGEAVRIYLPYGRDGYRWVMQRISQKPSTTASLARDLLKRG